MFANGDGEKEMDNLWLLMKMEKNKWAFMKHY